MSFLGNIVNKAANTAGALLKSPSRNQLNDEKHLRQPRATQGFSNNDNSIMYQDSDNDGIDDRLEPQHSQPGQNITGVKKHPNPKGYSPFSFKGKYKNYNVSYDRKGMFVPTATYPLPPVSHQQKLLDRNRRMRNKDNKFL